MRKLLIFVIFLYAAAASAAVKVSAGELSDSLDTGSLSFDGKLEFDGYYHKLWNNWSVNKTPSGINNNYSYSASTPSTDKGNTVFGETMFLNVGFHPTENLKGELGLEFIGGYADKYWMPVNQEHRMDINGQTVNWNRGEITYTDDWWELRYFRNIAVEGWRFKGDLFDLLPPEYNTQDYLRVSGRSVPEGYELDLHGKAGRLELIYGPEVSWGYKNGLYANYEFYVLGLTSNLMYRNHIVPYGDPDERMSTAELSTNIDVSNNDSLRLGVLYQPYRLDKPYTYVNYVAPGAGDLPGTNFNKESGMTGQSDALGYSAKLSLKKLPPASDILLQYTYLGLVAGNKNEINTQITEKITRSLTGCLDYTYRKPLSGPVPLVLEGTPANPGPAYLEPRDMNSPFRVDWDNREASLISFIFTYNPAPGTPFYLHEPNRLEEWNLNPEQDAAFSLAAKYTLSRYFSGTDRLYYWDENGNLAWDAPSLTEPWATDGYLGDLTMLARFKTKGSVIVFNAGGGDSLALNGSAYTGAASQGKPITPYFVSGVSVEHKPYLVKFRFSQYDWGPETWQRSYGEIYDKLYQLHVSRNFGEHINAGIEYVRGKGLEDNSAPELGSFDEVRLFFSISFGAVISFSEPVVHKAEPKARGITPVQADNTEPPKVSLIVPTTTFSPSDGQPLEIRAWATGLSGIASWKIDITNSEDKTVGSFTGQGQPPYSLKWDGIDNYKTFVPAGKYSIKLTAQDEAGNTSETVPVAIYVPEKTAPEEAPKDIKVTETERGLLVSMTSKVLFDSGKSALKHEAGKALDEVVKILNTYKDNKISVEGHTDSVGDAVMNQKLSEKRAQSVEDYLVNAGVSASRISVKGLGKTKPVATNSNAAGREANRRVEVIILKN